MTFPVFPSGLSIGDHASGHKVLEVIDAAAGIYVAEKFVETDWVNVRDYGALGDLSDDSDAIDRAITALPADGGVLYFPHGNYGVTRPVVINSDTAIIRGDGLSERLGTSWTANGSTITALPGFVDPAATDKAVVRFESTNPDGRPLLGAGMKDVRVNGAAGAAGRAPAGANHGVYGRIARAQFTNVASSEHTGNGIVLQGASVGNGDGIDWSTYDSLLLNCDASHNQGHGMHFGDAGADVRVVNSLAFDNTLNGFDCYSASTQFTTCHAYDNAGAGIRLANVRCWVTGSKIEGNLIGIDASSDNADNSWGGFSTITGNGFFRNTDTDVLYGGDRGDGGWTLTGNRFSGNDLGTVDIAVNAGTQYGTIVGNTFTGAYTNSYLVGGVGVKVGLNHGIPDDAADSDTVSRYGANSTGGVLDFNDPTNATHGSGASLLRGSTALNAPTSSPNAFQHPFSWEYATTDGSGNLTQLAVPYANSDSINAGLWMRGKFNGTFGPWTRVDGPDPVPSQPNLPTLTDGQVGDTYITEDNALLHRYRGQGEWVPWDDHEALGVSIHDYGPGVGAGGSPANIATNDAAFAWLKANHAGRPWLLEARDYYISTPVNIREIPGQIIVGENPVTTKIRQTVIGATVLEMGGAQRQRVERLSIIGAGDGQSPLTDGIGIEFELTAQFCVLDHILIWGVGTGVGMFVKGGTESGFFSNSLTNVRVSRFSGIGFDFKPVDIGVLGSGTGNYFSNLYVNNKLDDNSNGTCVGGMRVYGYTQNSFDQINLEAMAPTGPSLEIDESPNQVFDAVHLEDIEIPDQGALIQITSSRTTVNIRGLSLYTLITAAGSDTSVFALGNNCHVRVASMQYIALFGVLQGGFSLAREVGGPASQTSLIVVDADSLVTNAFTTANYLAAGVSDNVLRQYNQQFWSFSNDGGTVVRRVTAGDMADIATGPAANAPTLGAGDAGRQYFDTDGDQLNIWNGTAWRAARPYTWSTPTDPADPAALVGDGTQTAWSITLPAWMETTYPVVKLFADFGAGREEVATPGPTNITTTGFDLVFDTPPATGQVIEVFVTNATGA